MKQLSRNTHLSLQETTFEGIILQEPVRLVMPKPVFTKKQLKFLRIFVAAAAFVLLTTGVAMFFVSTRPNRFHAQVLSSAGLKSVFDDFHRGVLAGMANVKFEVTEKGEPVYVFLNEPTAAKDKHYTLETGTGNEFILRLPDNTLVWMNANSTINYPANFSADTINIFLNGEAYFETAPGSKKKFIITTSSISQKSSSSQLVIETLNSQFALTAYADDPVFLISLLRGDAEILVNGSSSSRALRLQPGQQAIFNGQLSINPSLDRTEVMALKNGEIYLKDVNLQVIMSRISKWYDVEVRDFSIRTENRYTLRFPMGTALPTIIESLQKQGAHLIVQDKIITILKS
jgi:transmembrane sensor